MLFPTAVLHMSIRVLGSPYTQAVCFLGTVEIFSQGSNTVSVTACLGVFSLCACALILLSISVDHSSLGLTVESRWPCFGLVQPIGKNWMGVLNETE
jgi:hypothetical protein